MPTLDLTNLNKQQSLTNPDTNVKAEVNKETLDDSTDDKSMILLAGPLSLLYTKALNLVYAHKKEEAIAEAVASESEVNDAFMEASEFKDFENENDPNQNDYINSTYVYVTDTASINSVDTTNSVSPGINKAFESISKLVDKKIFKNVIVVLEGMDFSNKTFLLEEYLNKSNIPVYRTRSVAIAKLSNL